MSTKRLKYNSFLLVMTILTTACAPLHQSDNLVEKGTIHVERQGTNEFQVNDVKVYSNAEGTHIHGELRRHKSVLDKSLDNRHLEEHVEITLQDRNGTVLYQGSMKPSHWIINRQYEKKSTIHDETFHVIVDVPIPEQGTVRVIYHPGPEH
ncbi:MAG: hypothetical protein H7832_14605 [Magnetococcus sp. DMHC-6]